MTLYNLRTTPAGYAITKFDEDLNPLATYAIEEEPHHLTCNCPADHRTTCRHRKMLTTLLPRADTAAFYNYETGAWVEPVAESGEQSDAES